MKKIAFYTIIDNLHKQSINSYEKHLKKNFANEIFKKAIKEKKIKIIYLSKNIFTNKDKNIHIKVDKEFSFSYYKYLVIKFEYEDLPKDFHIKLLNINIKNEVFYNLTKIIEKYQMTFLKTGHLLKLNYLDRKFLIQLYKEQYSSYLDNSIISKVLSNTNLSIYNKIYKMTTLLPKKNEIYSFYIKDIILKDSLFLKDNQIVNILKEKYNLELSRRDVCYIRKKSFIPNYENRLNFSFYTNYEKKFSKSYPLEKNFIKNLDKQKGVYEIISTQPVNYPYMQTNTLYIGSSKNLKNRLTFYINNNAHNEIFKKYLEKNRVFFRYIAIANYTNLEMQLMNSFINIYGSLPKLNIQMIRTI